MTIELNIKRYIDWNYVLLFIPFFFWFFRNILEKNKKIYPKFEEAISRGESISLVRSFARTKMFVRTRCMIHFIILNLFLEYIQMHRINHLLKLLLVLWLHPLINFEIYSKNFLKINENLQFYRSLMYINKFLKFKFWLQNIFSEKFNMTLIDYFYPILIWNDLCFI